jgi:4-hydroxy-3-polyprenylbenzoate decarboxylase
MNAHPTGVQVKPIVLAVTGASGVVYGARLLQILLQQTVPTHLTISESGAAVVAQELKVRLDLENLDAAAILQASNTFLKQPAVDFEVLVNEAKANGRLAIHHYKNYFTPIASGSFLTAGMVICPCSGSTLSGIAHAASQNLIQRAADVHLKEHRKLIVVPRETPLSEFQLENMHRLAQAGVVVLPASPGWYQGATELIDLVDFVVSRILDQLDVSHTLMQRWKETEV